MHSDNIRARKTLRSAISALTSSLVRTELANAKVISAIPARQTFAYGLRPLLNCTTFLGVRSLSVNIQPKYRTVTAGPLSLAAKQASCGLNVVEPPPYPHSLNNSVTPPQPKRQLQRASHASARQPRLAKMNSPYRIPTGGSRC